MAGVLGHRPAVDRMALFHVLLGRAKVLAGLENSWSERHGGVSIYLVGYGGNILQYSSQT